LLDRLAVGGASLLVATLDGIESGELVAREQPGDAVSFAPKLSVDDARVRWAEPAAAVDRRIRACTPTPGAWTTVGEERLKLGPVRLDEGPDLAAGELLVTKRSVYVGTGTSAVLLGTVTPHGRKAMPAADWARGARVESGARLG
jgi:methionyl-tRNA formyltransferase